MTHRLYTVACAALMADGVLWTVPVTVRASTEGEAEGVAREAALKALPATPSYLDCAAAEVELAAFGLCEVAR